MNSELEDLRKIDDLEMEFDIMRITRDEDLAAVQLGRTYESVDNSTDNSGRPSEQAG
jgi:hypothetical protein